MRTLKQLAIECLEIQNGCNPIGLALAYGRALADLRKALESVGLPNDSYAIKWHCINQWWLCKLTDLSGYPVDGPDSASYSQLVTLAESE